ncbi:hypothetical protein HAD_07430 [Hyphomonas adhaerens MHS-3]|uniref:Uncharacterized protein n=1 Tax=Hyphomonas adhaerens MHS-3 TaxID=1280949 RepID=A0A069E5Z0_9PROT|nr:hypothetical protein [Hyphomonas adhaerens]KCZ85497.1 hypothetical protein HAD_07430 [Hyphomonas adhaerens MHS-3]
MTDTPPVDPPEPPAGPPDKTGKPPKRPLLRRLFGISFWGGVKLTGLCILVGFFVMAANFNPAAQDANIPAALAAIAKQTLAAAGWAVRNFWKPALAGATIVVPLWVLWRLISLPFRK